NDPFVRIPAVEFLDASGAAKNEHKVADRMITRVHFECARKVVRPVFTVSFTDPENIQVVSNYTLFDGVEIPHLEGRGYVDFVIDRLPLKPSDYRCTITFTENGNVNNVLEWHEKAHGFKVLSNGGTSYGLFNPFPEWKVVSNGRVNA